MPVIVNIASEQEGTLRRFLDSFFQKDSKVDNDVVEWVNIYHKPLEAIDIITAVVDNREKYDIQIYISMDAGLVVEVSQKNVDDLIKFMLYRFYK